MGALGPQHLGGVFLVENLVAVAAFKCLLDHGGLLFRRGMRFGRAAVRASCPLHGKVRLLFLENAKGLVGDVGNAWCSKCWLCWRGLAVEMLRAWVRGNVARAACDLVRVGSGCGLAGEMMRVPSVAW